MLDYRGHIVSTVTMSRGHITIHVYGVSCSPFASYCVVNATGDENSGMYLESFVHIFLTGTSRRTSVSHDELPKHWVIHPDCANVTIQCITQRGVCTIAIPSLSQCFWTKIICYNTNTYITQYSPMQCSFSHIYVKITSVHRCLHQT